MIELQLAALAQRVYKELNFVQKDQTKDQTIMDLSTLEEQFNCLSIKFIFVCEDVSELNTLLSELNGLDYKNQKIYNSNSIISFLESLPKIPVTSDPSVTAKACHLIKQLISKQKILLPANISSRVVQWILKCCETKSLDLFFCEAFDALTLLFKANGVASKQVSVSCHYDLCSYCY